MVFFKTKNRINVHKKINKQLVKISGLIFLTSLFFISCPALCQLPDSTKSLSAKRNHTFLKQYAIPAALIGLGVYGTTNNSLINNYEIREERSEYFPGFTNKADNYLQYAPIPAVFIMDAFGLKGKHSWQEQLALAGRAELIMTAFVIPLKKLTHVLRPDSSSDNSFPSGHTAQAFMAAAFFNKEFGKKYPWASVGMFTMATGIGVLRILNNRHWVSDVLAGAGFGILSVELSYVLHKRDREKKKLPGVIMPSYQNGSFGFCALFKL